MDKYNLHQDKAGRYHKGITLVMPEDKKLQQDLVKLNYDSPTAAYPGVDKMHRMLLKQYWWLLVAGMQGIHIVICERMCNLPSK
jgi:hypothetical protein